jgi:hypothetical protein
LQQTLRVQQRWLTVEDVKMMQIATFCLEREELPCQKRVGETRDTLQEENGPGWSRKYLEERRASFNNLKNPLCDALSKPAEALGATLGRHVEPKGSVSAAPRAPTTKMKTPSINRIDTSALTDRSLNLNYFRRRGPDFDYTARGEAGDVRRLVAEMMKRVKYLKDRVVRGIGLEKALQIHNV